jgi:hypothetical protein
MKKNRLILLPILAVIMLAISLLLVEHFHTPAWRAKLNQYVAYIHQTGQTTSDVIASTPATSPASFTPSMSAESYGDNVIYDTSHSLNEQISAGLQPIPYPPDQVVCVLMDVDGQRQLVYVALHSDLYNADWIVHISSESWGSSTLQSQLATIGCSLDI